MPARTTTRERALATLARFAQLFAPACVAVLLAASRSALAHSRQPEAAPSNTSPARAPRVDVPAEQTGKALVKPFARHSLVYDNLFAVRVAPLGLVNRFALGYRYQLIDRAEPLFADSYAMVKGVVSLTPAFIVAGPKLEIAPLTVLRLGVAYQAVGYFGTLGNLQSFVDPRVDVSPDRLRDNRKAGLSYPSAGTQLSLDALVQGRVRQFIVRADLTAQYTTLKLRAGDRVYFDRLLDLPVANSGWSFSHNTDALWEPRSGLYFGARYSLVAAHYQREHFAPIQAPQAANGWIQRVGPAWMQRVAGRQGTSLDSANVFVLVQWHVVHRYRTGLATSAAIPCVMAGVILTGQLWRSSSAKR